MTASGSNTRSPPPGWYDRNGRRKVARPSHDAARVAASASEWKVFTSSLLSAGSGEHGQARQHRTLSGHYGARAHAEWRRQRQSPR